ncbi:hypothetical protein N7461_004857 [Penicillium sp. DV-2018c]|nr:hypothetical protein N7461_004857 [Penicillium sp. DV-2018c]
MSDSNSLNLTPFSLTHQTAPRNPNLSPWIHDSNRVVEPADEEALWVTVELGGYMQVDDLKLLLFVATETYESRATVDARAQHYLRTRCLSIPCTLSSASYEASRDRTFKLVKWWFEEVRAGRARLDRGVLIGPC